MDMDVNIVFVKPTKFEDCMKCIEHIKKDRIVHINLYFQKVRNKRQKLL